MEQWTDYQRYWMLKKLYHFYRNDSCFRFFHAPSLLAGFQIELMQSSNLEELEKRLQKADLESQRISLFRKANAEGQNFYYEFPSLSFQVRSLVTAWDAIAKFQAKREDLSKAIKNQDYEEMLASEIYQDDLDTARDCFGSKANYEIVWNPSRLRKARICDHERNLGLPLSIHFQYEYQSFRAKILQEMSSLVRENHGAILIQSDIQSFYHRLPLDFLFPFFDKQGLPAVAVSLRDLLVQGFTTLPTGWILSGFVANFFLLHIHQSMQNLLVENLHWKPVSYADDFVFMAASPEVDSDQLRHIVQSVLDEANRRLQEASDNNLAFHDIKHEKVRHAFFDAFSLLDVKQLFFRMDLSGIPGAGDFGMGIDELLAATTPPGEPNERSDIWGRLQNARRSLVRGEPMTDEQRKRLLNWAMKKVVANQGRYIPTALKLIEDIADHDLVWGGNPGPSETLIAELQHWCKQLFIRLCDSPPSWPILGSFLKSYARLCISLGWSLDEIEEFSRYLRRNPTLPLSESNDLTSFIDLLDLEVRRLIWIDNPRSQSHAIDPTFPEDDQAKTGFLGTMRSFFLQVQNFLDADDPNSVHLEGQNQVLAMLLAIRIREIDHQRALEDIDSMVIKHARRFSGRARQVFLFHSISAVIDNVAPDRIKDFLLSSARLYRGNGTRILSSIARLIPEIKTLTELSETERLEMIQPALTSSKAKFHLYKELQKLFPNTGEHLLLFMCVSISNSLNEAIWYLTWKIMTLESQQWMPWRSGIQRFQQTGHRMLDLLQSVYEMEVGANRRGSSLIFRGAFFKKFMKLSLAFRSREPSLTNISTVMVDLDRELRPEDGAPFFLYKQQIPIQVTLAPISYDINRLSPQEAYRFTDRSLQRLLNFKIRMAIDEAVSRRSSILIVPEMTVPEKYLNRYLSTLSKAGIVFIGGMEYRVLPGKRAQNVSIIAIPTRRRFNPLGRTYTTFEQVKNFPMTLEIAGLNLHGWQYLSQRTLYWFSSRQWTDFAVLTCSDFLSLTLRFLLQKRIQMLFVPAQNPDASTYRALGDASIRDLHCLALVCNGEGPESFCLAPYYDREKRKVFIHQGRSRPEAHTFTIDPHTIRKVQQEAPPMSPFRGYERWGIPSLEKPFEDHKQLPPDWHDLRR